MAPTAPPRIPAKGRRIGTVADWGGDSPSRKPFRSSESPQIGGKGRGVGAAVHWGWDRGSPKREYGLMCTITR